MRPIVLVLLAGVAEIIWAASLKASADLPRPGVVVVNIMAMLTTVWLLTRALRDLPLSTVYPIWTGIGAIGTCLVAVVVFREPVTFLRIAAALLILSGVAILHAETTTS